MMSVVGCRVEVLAIGDELLSGRTTDTNSTYLGEQLFGMGSRIERTTVICDDRAAILECLQASAVRSQVVLVMGGLGPTSDDLTAQCAAHFLGCDLVEHAPSRERLEAFCRARNRPVTQQNLKQVVYPAKAEPMPNPAGLAVGFRFRYAESDFFFLPGVPSEMKAMFQGSVKPWIETALNTGDTRIWTKTWRTLDLPESELQRRMDGVEAALPKEAWLGYRTVFPENHLTLYWRGESKKNPATWTDVESKIDTILQPFTYGVGDENLEANVIRLLTKKSCTVAFAESCSGGYAAQRLTRIPGASNAVWGGWVVYQTDAKERSLGVNVASDAEAQTPETARALALSALERSGADFSVAVVGNLGGGSDTPLGFQGVAHICVGSKPNGEARCAERTLSIPSRGREAMQWAVASYGLEMLRKELQGL